MAVREDRLELSMVRILRSNAGPLLFLRNCKCLSEEGSTYHYEERVISKYGRDVMGVAVLLLVRA